MTPDPTTLDAIRAAILEVCRPRAIYLYGSRARGDHRPDSDYDLLVVVWQDADPKTVRDAAYERLASFLDGTPDVKVVTAAEFEWRKRFVNTIEHETELEGIVLMAAREQEDRREIASGWFRMARMYNNAARMFVGDSQFARLLCFHSQQCLEHYLKGFLTLHGVRHDRTHQLEKLAAQCARIDSDFIGWIDTLRPLTKHAVETRSEDGAEPTAGETQEALNIAERFQTFILRRVGETQDRS